MHASRVTTASRNAACCRSSRACISALASSSLPEPTDVGAIGGTHQVREHMHLAERIADDGARRRRVGERGPIGTGNVAVPDCVTPQRVQACFCGRLVDRQAMAFVERLVQQLRRLVVAAGEADRGAVQIMVRAIRRCGAQFLQNLPQFAGGQACADDRAMQVGVELPDLRAPRRRVSTHPAPPTSAAAGRARSSSAAAPRRH